MAPVFEWCRFHISVVTRGADFWNHCYESHRMSWGRTQSRVVRKHSGPEGLTGGRLSLLSLLASPLSRVSLQRGVASSTKDDVTPTHQTTGLEFTVELHRLTRIKSAAMKGTWELKLILDCRKLKPCRSVFLGSGLGSFFSQRFCTVKG